MSAAAKRLTNPGLSAPFCHMQARLTQKDTRNIMDAAMVYVLSKGQAGYKDDHGKSWGDYIDECSGVWNHDIRKQDCRKHVHPAPIGVWYENNGRYNHERERELRAAMHEYLDSLGNRKS